MRRYSIGDVVDGKIIRVGPTHLTLAVDGATGRLPLADVRAVARRAKPIVGAEMNCTVIGRRRRDLLLSFDPG